MRFINVNDLLGRVNSHDGIVLQGNGAHRRPFGVLFGDAFFDKCLDLKSLPRSKAN